MSALLAGAALIAALAAPAAAAKLVWKIRGAGFGHGVGMSQYGAQGYAKHGKGYRAILRHYYRGIAIGSAPTTSVRVLLRAGLLSFRFTGATAACGQTLIESNVYTAARQGPSGAPSSVILRNAAGNQIADCGWLMEATGGASVTMLGEGTYRGTLLAQPRDVGVRATIRVGLDDYVRGVVPAEMPSSWPIQALRAQAVAARSYALANLVSGGEFDLYDDTRSQVYGGVDVETARTNRAVATTAGEVALYGGEVANTVFFSSSGGRTENNENVWGGDPVAYLRGVRDPLARLSPYHRWRARRTPRQMRRSLNDVTPGRFKRLRVIERGVSPRIVRVRLIGTGGRTSISGTQLQAELHLRSSWAYFRKVRPR